MKRYRTRRATVGVSLFPFLAVLICTMGALIVLLVLVVHMARVDASEDAVTADLTRPPDELMTQKADYARRRELLSDQRNQLLERAANKRLELSHLEEHIRELEKEWERLRQAATRLKQQVAGGGVDRDDAAQQLQHLEQSVRAAEDQLNEARAQAARRPPVYAIVPYDGPNGTRRRPIYLECVPGGVLIQPEGILFPLSDFQGPLGPGNPLDAALRAIREYYARVAPGAAQGEPYPLLIVRPEGVESYAMARSAMRAWDDEFGYELIDSDMKLKFPEADPQLAQLIRKATSDARSRQAALAAAMPSQFGNQSDIGYVASSQGGFVPRSEIERRSLGQRSGGFGRGGDSRHIDGQAAGRVAGQAPGETEQTVGGESQRGFAQGQRGAAIGQGCSPLADQRGRNWGLPGANANSTGIVRPLRLALLRDRIILLPDKGEARAPVVVLFEGGMADEMDEFVSKIWDRIDQWGMAVAGGYWKPVLHVHVTQGAEERFEEMKVLLDGSGLEVQRSAQ